MDILGTKSHWKDSNARVFTRKLNSFLDNCEDIKKGIEKFSSEIKDTDLVLPDSTKIPYGSFPYRPKSDVFNFSDTVIITFYNDVKAFPFSNSFFIYLIGSIIIPVFRNAFENGLAIRGTVSIGKFFRIERSTGISLIGPAINEAAQSYEDANWMGISASPSVSLTLEQDRGIDIFGKNIGQKKISVEKKEKVISQNEIQNLFNIIKNSFLEYDIPKKNGKERGWALAWPYNPSKGITNNNKIIKIFNKNLSYSRYQDNFVDNDIYLKYKNTKLFFDYLNNRKKNTSTHEENEESVN